MPSRDRSRTAHECVRKIKEYLDAKRSRDLKVAIGDSCSMQTIRNLASGDIKAVNSTVFKNGMLEKICSKLPDLRVERHYSAYQGFFKESRLDSHNQKDIRSFEGVYDVFHNGEESEFKIDRILIRCSSAPFFPNYILGLKRKDYSDNNDGFIFNSQNKLIMFGISDRHIVDMTMEKKPKHSFEYRKETTDQIKEKRIVNMHSGTINIFDVITGDSYFSVCLFLERDRNFKFRNEDIYKFLPDTRNYY